MNKMRTHTKSSRPEVWPLGVAIEGVGTGEYVGEAEGVTGMGVVTKRRAISAVQVSFLKEEKYSRKFEGNLQN